MIEVTKEMVEKIAFEKLERFKGTKRVYLNWFYSEESDELILSDIYIFEVDDDSPFTIINKIEAIYIDPSSRIVVKEDNINEIIEELKKANNRISMRMRLVKKLDKGEYITKLFEYFFLVKGVANSYEDGYKYQWLDTNNIEQTHKVYLLEMNEVSKWV